MTTDDPFTAEFEQLRQDAQSLRRTRDDSAETQTKPPPPDEGDEDSGEDAALGDVRQQLETLMTELAEAIEGEVAERPMTSLGAAFILGVLVGRACAR